MGDWADNLEESFLQWFNIYRELNKPIWLSIKYFLKETCLPKISNPSRPMEMDDVLIVSPPLQNVKRKDGHMEMNMYTSY